MSKQREIEAKYLLSPAAFTAILHDFPGKAAFTQENYYFDSASRSLHEHMCGLRIRVLQDRAEQTLKVPDPDKVQDSYHEVLEITDPLTSQQAKDLLAQKRPVFGGQVGRYLAGHFPDLLLEQVSWSKTRRSLLNGPQDCELTLDETSYPDGYRDFELEIENVSPAAISQASAFLQDKYDFTPSRATSNQNKTDRAWQHRLPH